MWKGNCHVQNGRKRLQESFIVRHPTLAQQCLRKLRAGTVIVRRPTLAQQCLCKLRAGTVIVRHPTLAQQCLRKLRAGTVIVRHPTLAQQCLRKLRAGTVMLHGIDMLLIHFDGSILRLVEVAGARYYLRSSHSQNFNSPLVFCKLSRYPVG